MTASAYIAFESFSRTLLESASSRDDVLGLVFVGSASATARADEWSDHDFFLITRDGAQERYRQDLSWLPSHDEVVLTARETDHGLKVIYADAHVLEFAVFSLAEIALAGANDYTVALDRGGVADAMTAIASRPRPAEREQGADVRLFIATLLIGVGRARRGETLSAGQLIRSFALSRLLLVWRRQLPSPAPDRLDDLDEFRRFERAYPEAAAQIAQALRSDPESCARALLEIAERELGDWQLWPREAAATVRKRLSWP